jgi:hypothetical protein
MVDIEDIATALSLTCRFNGQLGDPSIFYSVAQHCCLVAERMPPEVAIHGLLHDAAEAYIGDMASPIKECFPGFSHMEDRIMEVIYEALNLKPPTANIKRLIRQLDRDILYSEAQQLFRDPDWVDTRWTLFRNTKPFDTWKIHPVDSTTAYYMFNGMFHSRMLTAA